MAVPPSLAGENDVFSAFAQLLRLYHSPIPIEELIKGLPLDPLTRKTDLFSSNTLINNFVKAAQRVGFASQLNCKPLKRVSNLVLPAILLFKDNSSCILDKLDTERGVARIISPGCGDGIIEKSFEEIEESYSGYLILLSKKFDHSQREKESVKDSSRHWFFSAIACSWHIYVDVLVASIFINLFALISPIFTMNVYDRVIPNNAVETLWVLTIGVMVVFAFDGVLKFLRTWFIEIAAKKSDILISSRLFEQVMNLKMEHAPVSVGSFASNLREFDSVRNFLTSSVILVLIDLPFTVFLLGVVYYLGGQMVIVPIAIMLIIIFYSLLIKGPLFRSVADTFEANARKNALIVESLSGLQDIKFLNATGSFQWKWENLVAQLASKGLKTRLLSSSVTTITGVLMQVNTVFIVVMGVHMIQAQQMSMGALIAIVMLSSRIIAPVGQLVGLLSTIDQTRIAYTSTSEIMDRPAESVTVESVKKSNFAGLIEFKNVSFVYPNTEKPVLSDISFTVKPGEKVALLGRTGSGKTTIHKLITGLYKPQQGSVYIDGIEVSQYSLALLRQNINYVSQDFTIFSGSLRENILFKAPYADDQMILKAALTGGLEQFIRESPRGVDALIAERGANLSGGQKQGIAIARAFLLNAPIALLDEPTNSMDGTTEALVKNLLKTRTTRSTMILTTHKNNLLDMANRVIVIDIGKVIFDGSREDFFKVYMPSQKVEANK